MARQPTWTDADKLFLRENYHTLGWKAVAEKLGKSGPGVRGMAGRIGIVQKKHKPKSRWSRTRFKRVCEACKKQYMGRLKLCPECRKKVKSNMAERICKNCIYYKPDYGTFCVNGWSRDGSSGYCNVEPKKLYVGGGRTGCRFWRGKEGGDLSNSGR